MILKEYLWEDQNRGQNSTSLKMGVEILHGWKTGVKILQCLKKGSIFYIRPLKVGVKILHRLKKGSKGPSLPITPNIVSTPHPGRLFRCRSKKISKLRIVRGIPRWPVNLFATGRTGRFEWNLGSVVFKVILVIGGWGIPCGVALRRILLDLTDDE